MERVNGIPKEVVTPAYLESVKQNILYKIHNGMNIRFQSELDEMNLFEIARKKHVKLFDKYDMLVSLCKVGDEYFAYIWYENILGDAQGFPEIQNERIPMKEMTINDRHFYTSAGGAIVFSDNDIASYKIDE